MNGTFTDPRDGQIYKTVEINGQTWMAENLKYKGVTYNAPYLEKSNTTKQGCLYTWSNAMKACPPGWRLPTQAELQSLIDSFPLLGEWRYILRRIREEVSTYSLPLLWKGGFFSILLRNLLGKETYFWSSTDNGIFSSYYMYLGIFSSNINSDCQGYNFFVRCIKA